MNIIETQSVQNKINVRKPFWHYMFQVSGHFENFLCFSLFFENYLNFYPLDFFLAKREYAMTFKVWERVYKWII